MVVGIYFVFNHKWNGFFVAHLDACWSVEGIMQRKERQFV